MQLKLDAEIFPQKTNPSNCNEMKRAMKELINKQQTDKQLKLRRSMNQ